MLFLYLAMVATMLFTQRMSGMEGLVPSLVLPIALSTLTAYHALGRAARMGCGSSGVLRKLFWAIRVPMVALAAGSILLGYPTQSVCLATLLLLPYYGAVGLVLASWLQRWGPVVAMCAFVASYALESKLEFIWLGNPVVLVGPALTRLAWGGGCGTCSRRMLWAVESSPTMLLSLAAVLLVVAKAGFARARRRSCASAITSAGTSPRDPWEAETLMSAGPQNTQVSAFQGTEEQTIGTQQAGNSRAP